MKFPLPGVFWKWLSRTEGGIQPPLSRFPLDLISRFPRRDPPAPAAGGVGRGSWVKAAPEPEGEADAKLLLRARAFEPGVVSLTLAFLFLPVLRQAGEEAGAALHPSPGPHPFQRPSMWVWGGELCLHPPPHLLISLPPSCWLVQVLSTGSSHPQDHPKQPLH